MFDKPVRREKLIAELPSIRVRELTKEAIITFAELHDRSVSYVIRVSVEEFIVRHGIEQMMAENNSAANIFGVQEIGMVDRTEKSTHRLPGFLVEEKTQQAIAFYAEVHGRSISYVVHLAIEEFLHVQHMEQMRKEHDARACRAPGEGQ